MTRTPPADRDDTGASAAVIDSDFIGAVALQPCSFTTGSYGWKGSKRLAIDIVDPASGEKKKVQVMLTYVFLMTALSPHTDTMDPITESMPPLWVASKLKRKRALKFRLTLLQAMPTAKLLGPRSGSRDAVFVCLFRPTQMARY